jgi:PPOX class probable F420-dependent enzyme
MVKVPESHADILKKKSFAHFATLMPDGTPQVSPVWVDQQGDYVLINSALGRVKDKNVHHNPAVAISVCDPDNPYRMLSMRGNIVAITQDGADEHIDKMAKKYMGQDKYPFRKPGEVRVIYKIELKTVNASG